MTRFSPKSLRHRMIIVMWLLACSTMVLGLFLAAWLTTRQTDKQAYQRLRAEEANLVALGVFDLIELNPFSDVLDRLAETLNAQQLNEGIRVYLDDGQLIFTNRTINDASREPWQSNRERLNRLNRAPYQ